jgi:uncharacterized ion transporter superfamily protein YfcC
MGSAFVDLCSVFFFFFFVRVLCRPEHLPVGKEKKKKKKKKKCLFLVVCHVVWLAWSMVFGAESGFRRTWFVWTAAELMLNRCLVVVDWVCGRCY